MHILIIEAALTGHHSGYLERIAAAYMDAGHSVSVTVLQGNAKHLAIERLKSTYGAAFNVVPLNDAKYQAALHSSMGEPGRELALRRMFGKAYSVVHQSNPVDYVFIPYLDYCLYALGLLGSPFGSAQWGGICMRPSFHYSQFGVIAPKPKLAKVKHTLFLRLFRSKTLKAVYTIDELLHRFVAEQHPQWVHRLQYVPDPAELNGSHTYKSARQELGIPDEAVVVLVYGAIDERKGLDVLVEALRNPDVSKTLYLLVVGKQASAIQPLMTSPQFSNLSENKRCHVINSYVDEVVQQMVFTASDVVWLGYRNHYSMSGVLVMAAVAGKAVIASQDGLIGWYTRKQGLGISIDTRNLCQVAGALNAIASGTVRPKTSRQMLGRHSWTQFIAAVLKAR